MNLDELRRRAETGNCAAQALLGICYLYGDQGVQIDQQEAFRLLSAAAQAGASRAVLNLAHMYARGLGIAPDVDRAIKLYESVAHVEFYAAIALGRIYAQGIGVSPSRDLAYRWYSVATSFQGRVHDCEELAEAKAFIS